MTNRTKHPRPKPGTPAWQRELQTRATMGALGYPLSDIEGEIEWQREEQARWKAEAEEAR